MEESCFSIFTHTVKLLIIYMKNISEDFLEKTHLIILGAGATMAAIPDGDKNGRKSSVMNGFLENLGLEKILDGCKLKTESRNIEDIYSELSERTDCAILLEKLEEQIYTYFSNLRLPDKPTEYDYLILSLRDKDLIASFNWDPLLLEAWNRVGKITKNRPQLAFLHGNVCVGKCETCEEVGHITRRCSKCNRDFKPGKILFPVKKKNYRSDIAISNAWNIVKKHITNAGLVTFFGYSAPSSDIDAIEMLKKIYNSNVMNRYTTMEIIDTNPKVIDVWEAFNKFGGDGRVKIVNTLFESNITEFPRRSIEGFAKRTYDHWWNKGASPIIPNLSWDELKILLAPIIEEEQREIYTVR